MALRFLDGFDHYGTINQKWTSGGAIAFLTTGQRFGIGSYVRVNESSQLRKFLDNQAGWVVGAAMKFSGLVVGNIITIRDSGTLQMELSLLSTGQLQVTRNGAVLATSTTSVISLNVWYFIEFKTVINNTTGSYEVRLQGATVAGLSATGVDTQNTANAYANDIYLTGTAGSNSDIDDVYICDSTGSTNNDFLGDVRVDTIFPTADGSSTDFTPSTGTDNYAMVDEVTPDSDSTYVASSTLNDLDLYTFADLQSLTGTVYGIQSVIFARKDDAGTRSVAPAIKTGATTAIGSGFALSASYSYNTQVFETNPANGSAAWTISDVNNSEFGVKVTA